MKRKIRVPGEKTKLLCENCGDLRSATWNYGDFELENGTVVSGVMLAFCDECHEQAGFASQSSYLLREAREERQKRLRTNVTLSKALRDLAESRLHTLGSSTMSSIEAVILAVLAAIEKGPQHREKVLKLLDEAAEDPLLNQGKWDTKVTIRLSPKAERMIQDFQFNRSDFVRRAILLEDSEIEDNLKQFALV